MPRLSPAPTSSPILKTLAGIIVAVLLSVTSWLLLSQINSQVAQAKTAGVITNIAKDVHRIEQRDGKVGEAIVKMGEAIVSINLANQRVADMLTRHDEAIKELQAERRR